jgi:hypothetical protein
LYVAIGDSGETPHDALQRLAFDSPSFDPDDAVAFVRYWSWQQASACKGRGMWRVALSPMSVEIAWPAWAGIAIERRRAFLRAIVRPFGSVLINGHELATWPGVRALLGLGPRIEANGPFEV